MSRRLIVPALTLAVPVLFAGCADDQIVTCDGRAEWGLMVRAVDASTGRVVTATASAEARDGTLVETLQYGNHGGWDGLPAEEGVLVGALERAGTFALRVTAPGFRPWEVAQVRVGRDNCGVTATRVTARLVPLAP